MEENRNKENRNVENRNEGNRNEDGRCVFRRKGYKGSAAL